MPVLDTGQLMVLVTSMLGLGAMRSFDKVKGTDAPAPAPKGTQDTITVEPNKVTVEQNIPPKKKKWRL